MNRPGEDSKPGTRRRTASLLRFLYGAETGAQTALEVEGLLARTLVTLGGTTRRG